uniref:Uncharacterized protein n=1 Tax=Plectus sambesii TaxID=2011161 RepID=A0A914W4J2_9BILA
MKVQLRVGTSKGVSDWSKPFDVPNSSWPLAVILAVAFGAFIITVLLAALGFCYYYKKHVQNYVSVYTTLNNLLHNRRAGGIGQSFRKPAPLPPRELPPIFTVAISADSLLDTKFEPTPQPQSPCSAEFSERDISDSHIKPSSGTASVKYIAADFL